MISGIYKITNNLNNHFYIGQSKNIKKRWHEHVKSAVIKKTHYTTLQNAFHKYGIENFKFEIVEECTSEKLDEREIFYIDTLKPEYNMNKGGSGNTGYVVSNETRKILSNYGRKQWNSYTEEKKQNIIKNQLTGPTKGKPRTEYTKLLISKKVSEYYQKNNGMSETCKKRISDSLKGKKRPNYGHYKPVKGISDNGFTFLCDSIKNAAFIVNVDKSGISHCLDGKRKKSAGLRWEYCSQETIQFWSREDLITSRSAMHPSDRDEDIVHAITKNGSYGVHDKGLIALARRSNTIKTIAAEPVYSNDIFDVQLGVGRTLSHKMNLMGERGEIIGYYCLVELVNGGIQFCVKSKADIEKHRDKFSKAYNKEDKENIWNKNFDAMALKTCVIQALKLCPISIEALEAVNREEIEDTKEVVADESEFTVTDDNIQNAEVVVEEKQLPESKSEFAENNGMTPEEEKLAEQAFEAQQQTNDGDVF